MRFRLQSCFLKKIRNKKKYSEKQIVGIIEIVTDDIFVEFCGHMFQQKVRIPMETNCALLLVDLYVYSYEKFI